MKITVEEHFDKIASKYESYKIKHKFYYDNLKKLIARYIPENKAVLEVGCGTGDLITHLKPKNGWGMDISKAMVLMARKRHKNIKNIVFSTKMPMKKYDFVLMCDVIEHLEQPLVTFRAIHRNMKKSSKFLITMANPFWEPLLLIAEKLNFKMPEGPHNRISYLEIKKLLERSGMKILQHRYSLLMPIRIPYLSALLNKYLEKHLRKYSFIEYMVVGLSK